MIDRPVFKSYAKQLIAIIFNVPINSNGKLYTFADRWLLLIGQLPIITALIFIYNYSPFSVYYGEWLPSAITYFIGALFIAAYWLFFVYRFARFHVEWADPEAHSNESASKNQDEFGCFLVTKENRKQAIKSRGAFAAVMTAIAAFTFLCCYVMYGLAPSRLYYGHKKELDRLIELTRDLDGFIAHTDYYGELIIGVWLEGLDDYESQALTSEIKDIISNIPREYVLYIGKDDFQNCITILMSAKWGVNCAFEWYPEEIDKDIILNNYIDAEDVNIIKLEEHWWQVWYSFDS